MKMVSTQRVVKAKIVRLTVDFTQQELSALRANLELIIDRSCYSISSLTRTLLSAIKDAEQVGLNTAYRSQAIEHVDTSVPPLDSK